MEFIVYEHDVLSAICKGKNKWGMYISFDPDEDADEIMKAAPYLEKEKHYQVFFRGEAYFLFDTKEEMEQMYWLTVGDDGPTKLNPYNGPVRIYATTSDPTGRGLNENT